MVLGDFSYPQGTYHPSFCNYQVASPNPKSSCQFCSLGPESGSLVTAAEVTTAADGRPSLNSQIVLNLQEPVGSNFQKFFLFLSHGCGGKGPSSGANFSEAFAGPHHSGSSPLIGLRDYRLPNQNWSLSAQLGSVTAHAHSGTRCAPRSSRVP